MLAMRPALGRVRPDILGAPYWFWSLPGFSYVLVYDPRVEPVQIVRVLHTSRDLRPLLSDLDP